MKILKIVSNTKYFVSVSVSLIIIGFIFVIINGLNLGIDFTGGTLMTVNMSGAYQVNDITNVLNNYGLKDAAVAESGEGQVKDKAVIRMKDFSTTDKETEIRAKILKDIQVKYPKAQLESIEKVGATAGREMIQNAFYSVVMACILMLIYIWFRFELLFGVAAVIALVHDVSFMIAAVSILKIPVNSSFIAAVLTIIGYSINDTIVVFDRIRENNKKFNRKQKSRSDIVDISITETMTRSINTVLTVVITTTAIYVLGVESIKEFALPLLVGLISGCYSSIFIASPIWCVWADHNDKNKKRLTPQKA